MKRKILIILAICIVLIMIIPVISLINKSKNDMPISYNEDGNKMGYDETYSVIGDLSKENKITSIINDTTIQGLVELKRDKFIYIFGGQHFGELGYEIEEYTSSNIDNKNQTCIDYITLEKHDTNYIEEGDLLICTGDLTKRDIRFDNNDIDTKDNAIIVLKAKDYNKMKENALQENTKIIAGWTYIEEGYMYLKYDIEDKTHSDKTYYFPFIQKAYITSNTKIIGELEKGKSVKVQYNDSSEMVDGLELKVITVIE